MQGLLHHSLPTEGQIPNFQDMIQSFKVPGGGGDPDGGGGGGGKGGGGGGKSPFSQWKMPAFPAFDSFQPFQGIGLPPPDMSKFVKPPEEDRGRKQEKESGEGRDEKSERKRGGGEGKRKSDYD